MMINTKKILVATSLTLMALVLSQWGYQDGLAGKASGLITESIAAESQTTSSPVKARARDFYAPNSEDLMPDEMRLIA